MTTLITHNPYRILGVYSNSPKKDVLSNLNKMKAFLKVGREVSFPLDLPNFLPLLKRDETIVTSAQSSIELPVDQLKHSLFWFMKVTPLDDIAFNHLFSGNIQQAKEIWHKKECVSSLLNLMVCAIIENDNTSFAINADQLFQNYATNLCTSVNEILKLSSDQLIELLVNILNDDGSIDLSSLARVPGTSSSWQKAFSASTIKPLIDEISSAINEAKNVRGASANYNSGVKLMNSTKEPLTQLRGLLGTSDMQYQMIADKLAQTILQCGINYFNDTQEDDAPQKAMTLQNYALSIAVGQMAKDRCKENVDILKNIGPEYKIQKEMSRIALKLKQFNSKANQTSSSYSFSDLTNSRYSLQDINTFVDECKPDLLQIKQKIGAQNELYIKISSAVASASVNALVDVINKDQQSASLGLSHGGFTIVNGLSTMRRIGALDMSSQCRNYYQSNLNTLNQIYNRVCPKVDNSSGGCYIATMAYGDYDHPQVLVLRNFRDTYLAHRDWGKQFIKYYYAHSPHWVERLKGHSVINASIRKALDMFVLIWKKISHYE